MTLCWIMLAMLEAKLCVNAVKFTKGLSRASESPGFT